MKVRRNERQSDGQRSRQTDRQIGKQADINTDRHAYGEKSNITYGCETLLHIISSLDVTYIAYTA